MMDSKGIIIGSAVVGGLSLLYFYRRYFTGKWEEVAEVDKLFIHPIKSCRGIAMDSFTAEPRGIYVTATELGDRSFMMTHEDGRFATIRHYPKMVLITPSIISDDELRLSAPDMDSIVIKIPKHGSARPVNYTVWGYACPGIDCGDEVANWLQEYTKGKNTRLVYHNQQLPTRKTTKFMDFGHLGLYDKGPLESMFQDYSAFNVLSQKSIDVVNTKLDDEHKVNVRFFRPNVLLKGCSAFAEDDWKRVRIGTAEFVFAKHTTRCRVTTVNPDNGVMDMDRNTLTTLSSFRLCKPEEKPIYGNSPKISVDYIVVRPGIISVGDKVYVYNPRA